MEQQALLAKEAISRYWSTGDRPVQALQGQLCIIQLLVQKLILSKKLT